MGPGSKSEILCYTVYCPGETGICPHEECIFLLLQQIYSDFILERNTVVYFLKGELGVRDVLQKKKQLYVGIIPT